MVKIQCPNCQTLLAIQENMFGQQFRCPTCATVLFVPAPSSVPPAPPSDSAGAGPTRRTDLKAKTTTKAEGNPAPSPAPGQSGGIPKTSRELPGQSQGSQPKSSIIPKTAGGAKGRRDDDSLKAVRPPGPRMAPSSADGVIEVTVREGDRQQPPGQSPILCVVAAVFAFVLPVAAAGTFVALNWYQGSGK